MRTFVKRKSVLAVILLLSAFAAIGPRSFAADLDDYCSGNAQKVPFHMFTVSIPTQDTQGLSPAATARVLGEDGILLSSNPPGSVRLLDDRAIYSGQATEGVPGMSHSVLLQVVQGPVDYTFTFAHPIIAFAFIRAPLIAGPHGITHPAWTATAFDSAGHIVASTSENEIRSFSNVAPQSFLLAGPHRISYIRFAANNHHFDAFANVVVDAFAWCP